MQSYKGITGRVVTTVNVTGAKIVPCNFTLRQGFNLASFPCVTDYYEIEQAFENVTGLVAVFGYDKNDQDHWKVYNPNLPEWVVQDLSYLEKKKGYWVLMNSSSQFYLSGPLSATTNIHLSQGYNLVGYPSSTEKSVEEALQSINGSYTKVVGFNNTAKQYLVYVPGANNTLLNITPYRGYWINMSQQGVWVVNR